MWRRSVSSHHETLTADVVADSPRRLTVLCGELASEIEISGSAFSDLNTWSSLLCDMAHISGLISAQLHCHECKALTRLEKEKRKFVTPTIRMMVKLYIKRNVQNEKVLPITTTDNYSLVEALVSQGRCLGEGACMWLQELKCLWTGVLIGTIDEEAK
ncbi:hypothetical protein ISN45_Aa08g017200 [Arabidopsis thaliana x Arabidopsis arenosa]|uniref:Uncharacterized protein n=1 Tax=Arabidopsis thaliana x Arabidopsis arenosa TaxID=1240361 RepID=A0A8T1XSF7_9BRAS|nr:hypothetical protein ISN45_Aa08g017200 [Arabidopsis thaliana x Arabidopsis arenosa]